MSTKLIQTKDYLLLIDEEAEIKEGDYYFSKNNNIVTTCDSKEEAKECAVLRHNDFKIIAYYPLSKEAKELDLPLLPNPFENEVNIEKLAINSFGHEPTKDDNNIILSLGKGYVRGFQAGYKAAQSKQFSLEDIIDAFSAGEASVIHRIVQERDDYLTIEEYIQSLSTQQLPKAFIPEYINTNSFGSETNGYDSGSFILKTITNSEGKEELVGTYKY